MATKKTQQIGFGGFGSFGDRFARVANITAARIRAAKDQNRLEHVARQLGADLSDPEEFRIVRDMVGNK